MSITQRRSLDSNAIKLIAILAMTVDHIAWAVFPGYPRAALPLLMQCISQAQLCCDLLDTNKTDVLIQNILGEGMPRVMDAVAEGRRLDDGSL